MRDLNASDRNVNSFELFDTSYNTYIKLIEQSSVLQHNLKKDELAEVDLKSYLPGFTARF